MTLNILYYRYTTGRRGGETEMDKINYGCGFLCSFDETGTGKGRIREGTDRGTDGMGEYDKTLTTNDKAEGKG